MERAFLRNETIVPTSLLIGLLSGCHRRRLDRMHGPGVIIIAIALLHLTTFVLEPTKYVCYVFVFWAGLTFLSGIAIALRNLYLPTTLGYGHIFLIVPEGWLRDHRGVKKGTRSCESTYSSLRLRWMNFSYRDPV